jgi:hypothetical protein
MKSEKNGDHSNDVHIIFKWHSHDNSDGVHNIQMFGTVGGKLWRNYL